MSPAFVAIAPNPESVAHLAEMIARSASAGTADRQRRVLGRGVGRARGGRHGELAGAVLLQRSRSRPAARPTTSNGVPADARPAQAAGRSGRRDRHPARLPSRVRLGSATPGWPTSSIRNRRWPNTSTSSRSSAISRRRARRAWPSPPVSNGGDHGDWVRELRDAEEAARAAEQPVLEADSRTRSSRPRIYGELRKRLGARCGGDLRWRRLRVVRGQVCRGLRARLLARHRPVRLSRQRDWAMRSPPGWCVPTPRSS